jgi:hypothetical protein
MVMKMYLFNGAFIEDRSHMEICAWDDLYSAASATVIFWPRNEIQHCGNIAKYKLQFSDCGWWDGCFSSRWAVELFAYPHNIAAARTIFKILHS